MAYLLIQENDTTQLAIGPIRGFQAVDGKLHIKLDEEELRAWHTVTGWEVQGNVLIATVAEQQVTIKRKKYDLGKVVGMGDPGVVNNRSRSELTTGDLCVIV